MKRYKPRKAEPL